jgi:hypothetical protein
MNSFLLQFTSKDCSINSAISNTHMNILQNTLVYSFAIFVIRKITLYSQMLKYVKVKDVCIRF